MIGLDDPLVTLRAVHFAATLVASGVVLFAVLIAAPAFGTTGAATGAAAFRARLLRIGWWSLAVAMVSGAGWLVLTAQSMCGQALSVLLPQGVLWTVLARTDFGNDWLLRASMACLIAAALPFVLVARPSRVLAAASTILAAAFSASLAFAGHAIGAIGIEGILHPAADALHLVGAAGWLGSLPLLAMLFTAARHDAALVPAAQTATTRFSTLGIISVGLLAATGVVNSWYLAGSVPALIGTDYGRLLLVKVALFFAMVAVAAVNRLRLTPRLVQTADAAAAQQALRPLRRNAAIETLFGAFVVVLVAAIGTLPPASHAGHEHPAYGAVPAESAFVHIHSEEGMADVTITPGRAGPARATIRLWDSDFGPLDATGVTLKLAAPGTANPSSTRIAVRNADGAWQIDGIALSEPGDWTVTVDATLGPAKTLILDAAIAIEPAR